MAISTTSLELVEEQSENNVKMEYKEYWPKGKGKQEEGKKWEERGDHS